MRPALSAVVFAALTALAAPSAFAQDSCEGVVATEADQVRYGRQLTGDRIGGLLDACGTDGPARLVRALTASGDCDQGAQVGRSLVGHAAVESAVEAADACLSTQLRSGLEDLDEAVARTKAGPSEDSSRTEGEEAEGPVAGTGGLLGRVGSGRGGGGGYGYGYGYGGGDTSGDDGSRPSSEPATAANSADRSGATRSGERREKRKRGRRASTGAGSYDPGPIAMRHGPPAPISRGAPVAWSSLDLSVWFDVDSAGLRPEALATLATVARSIQSMTSDAVLEVVGHTDSTGAWTYNADLSVRRARSVQQALVLAGADPARVTVRGAGEDLPAASNATWWGRARNRRVEFRFYRPVAIKVTR